eukprot:2360651-Pleurochrysis_carterae.AAC.1
MRPQPAKPVLVEQRDACEALLSDMIRELLTSTDVRRVLTSAEMEEVPWFAQLRADAEGGDGGGASGGKRAGDGAAQCVVEPDAPLGDDATLEQVFAHAERAFPCLFAFHSLCLHLSSYISSFASDLDAPLLSKLSELTSAHHGFMSQTRAARGTLMRRITT